MLIIFYKYVSDNECLTQNDLLMLKYYFLSQNVLKLLVAKCIIQIALLLSIYRNMQLDFKHIDV